MKAAQGLPAYVCACAEVCLLNQVKSLNRFITALALIQQHFSISGAPSPSRAMETLACRNVLAPAGTCALTTTTAKYGFSPVHAPFECLIS